MLLFAVLAVTTAALPEELVAPPLLSLPEPEPDPDPDPDPEPEPEPEPLRLLDPLLLTMFFWLMFDVGGWSLSSSSPLLMLLVSELCE